MYSSQDLYSSTELNIKDRFFNNRYDAFLYHQRSLPSTIAAFSLNNVLLASADNVSRQTVVVTVH